MGAPAFYLLGYGDQIAKAVRVTMTRMDSTRMMRGSRAVVAVATLMLATGILCVVFRAERMSRTDLLAMTSLLIMVAGLWFAIRPGAATETRPWRDQGRLVLWLIVLACLLSAVSLWLSAILGVP